MNSHFTCTRKLYIQTLVNLTFVTTPLASKSLSDAGEVRNMIERISQPLSDPGPLLEVTHGLLSLYSQDDMKGCCNL